MTIHDENPDDENVDNALLRIAFDRQLRVSLLVDQITCLLYKARSEWIGGAMDFKDLTAAQKAMYRAEVEQLIKQPIAQTVYRTAIVQMGGTPQGDGDGTDFDGRTEEGEQQ